VHLRASSPLGGPCHLSGAGGVWALRCQQLTTRSSRDPCFWLRPLPALQVDVDEVEQVAADCGISAMPTFQVCCVRLRRGAWQVRLALVWPSSCPITLAA
jgi:hypothetical protein